MNIENTLDYIRLLTVTSFHNNLNLESIVKLFEANITIGGTKQFWMNKHRIINGNHIDLSYPIYKYNYFTAKDEKAIKYGDVTTSELKQAVKNGTIEKRALLKGYKNIQIFNIDNTVGEAFNIDEYKLKLLDIMKKSNEYDVEHMMNSVLLNCSIESSIEYYVRNATEYILGIDDIGHLPEKERVYEVINALIRVFNAFDNIVVRPKLINIKQEIMDDLIDTIICGIDAQNVRALIGGE